ncbi:hypothetical protein LJC56_03370 [Christensenellaceae bacterium OttesenSCG-928-K19]|nr:hypothetical protein [Christensenellaceae bacterium OttesenSCG-928-K19]
MPTCKKCGTSNLFLLLTNDGLCRPCEITRQISLNSEFQISKVFHVFLPNNYIFYVAVDDENKQFALCTQLMSKPLRINFYNYADLIEFEVSESEPVKSMCNAMMVNVYLNSLDRPHISFYILNSPVQFGSKAYYKAVRMAKQIYAVLRYLQHNAKLLQEQNRMNTLQAGADVFSLPTDQPQEPEADAKEPEKPATKKAPARKHAAKKSTSKKPAAKRTPAANKPAAQSKPDASSNEEEVADKKEAANAESSPKSNMAKNMLKQLSDKISNIAKRKTGKEEASETANKG